MNDAGWETLSGQLRIRVSAEHRFGTDAFLLEDFSGVRGTDTVCDLCAGCGIIGLLTLRRERPPRQVTALEIAPAAVALMQETHAACALGDRFTPLQGDLRQISSLLPSHTFRLVTCNPPYFSHDTGFLCPDDSRLNARHESEGSCTIADVCRAAAYLLQYGGRFCLCQRPERLPEVLSAMGQAGLTPKRLRFVQKLPGTAPWLFLAEGRVGGKAGLSVLSPLFVEDGAGGYSEEMKRIYHLS